MIYLLYWTIDLYPHREHWSPECVYHAFGFGRPFCIRGTLRFGVDDFGVVDPCNL